jgi:hypothetical protein
VFLVSFVAESLQVNGLIRARSGVHTTVLLKIVFWEAKLCQWVFPDISMDVSVFYLQGQAVEEA